MTLNIRLTYVVDLCTLREQKILGTNSQELTGDWMISDQTAPTQQLGQALFELPHLEGFLFPSAKAAGRNLIIYPDKLMSTSFIRFHNEISGRGESIR